MFTGHLVQETKLLSKFKKKLLSTLSQKMASSFQIVDAPSVNRIIVAPQPPPRHDLRFVSWRPNCGDGRYRNFPNGGLVIDARNNQLLRGNCTPNTQNNPFIGPFDFTNCNRQGICFGSNGVVGRPNQICCPGPRFF